MTGQLTDAQMDILLTSCVLGRLGCYAEHQLYVVPITYAYQSPFIYSHTREGQKIAMMRKNPEVCFEVDQIDNLSNWRSVIVWGTFEELQQEDAEQAAQIVKNRLLPLRTSIYSHSLRDLRAKDLSRTHQLPEVIFRIRVAKKTGKFEKSGS